jgi:hypothetical protein
MYDLASFARHLEVLNALADAAHEARVRCVVSLGQCPVHGLRLCMQGPFPAPAAFSTRIDALAAEHEFQFCPVESTGSSIVVALQFLPTLSELGSPVPEAPLTDPS